jgi:hypothetical protein
MRDGLINMDAFVCTFQCIINRVHCDRSNVDVWMPAPYVSFCIGYDFFRFGPDVAGYQYVINILQKLPCCSLLLKASDTMSLNPFRDTPLSS